MNRVVGLGFAEREPLSRLHTILPHISCFTTDEIPYCNVEKPVLYPVIGVGNDRFETTLDLMFSLGTRIEALQAFLDRVLDSLIVAGLEVQELIVFQTSPITPIKRLVVLQT